MLTPGYGETPISGDELESLLPALRRLLGESPCRAAVYDIEQAIQVEVTQELVNDVVVGALELSDLLTDRFLRELHKRLYGDVWKWGGLLRVTEVNIGVSPAELAAELRQSLGNISYRWQHTDDWSPHQLGVVVHAETVRVHPFTDGNGRTTRLLADLVLAAAQDADDELRQYDWDVDKARYIELLRVYDRDRESSLLPTSWQAGPLTACSWRTGQIPKVCFITQAGICCGSVSSRRRLGHLRTGG